MNKILEIALKLIPKKYVTYAAALALAVLGVLEVESGLPPEQSVWPDVPPGITSGLTMIAGAAGLAGMRRGVKKAEDAAKNSSVDVSELP